MTSAQAVKNFLGWCLVAVAVNVLIYFVWGSKLAGEFAGAWAMEKALSLDNLFCFYLIFSTYHVPEEARPRVLLWGIAGVVVLRGLFVFGGTTLLATFHWLLYPLALWLFWAAYKVLFFDEDDNATEEEKQRELESKLLVKLATRVFSFDRSYDGNKFFVRRLSSASNRTLRPTLLLLTVTIIEATDIAFAMDSLPAALAISQNFWIVMSSNLIAVMGLRAIYFLIQNMRKRFAHLQVGIGLLLAFAGFKIVGPTALDWVGRTFEAPALVGFHLPLWMSLTVIGTIITVAFAYTLLKTRNVPA